MTKRAQHNTVVDNQRVSLSNNRLALGITVMACSLRTCISSNGEEIIKLINYRVIELVTQSLSRTHMVDDWREHLQEARGQTNALILGLID